MTRFAIFGLRALVVVGMSGSAGCSVARIETNGAAPPGPGQPARMIEAPHSRKPITSPPAVAVPGLLEAGDGSVVGNNTELKG
jgi:hypothetical protein